MPAGLPTALSRFDRVLDRRLHVGVLRIAEMAERGRQIGRPDEHAVDAVDLGDRFDLVERGAGFHLHQNADLVIRLGQIAGHAAVAAGARGNRDAADAMRRIARRRDRALGLLGFCT